MKRILLRTANSLLTHLGIEISRTKKGGVTFVHDPSLSFMKDDYLLDLLIEELVEISHHFFADRTDLNLSIFDLKSEIRRFWEVYSGRPFGHNRGGSGFHNAFWIYLFARILKPSLIVESGVWKGHTSWLLEQACPDATIHGFDINLGNLEYRTGKVRFHEQDWSGYEFHNVDQQKSLIFFDCHVNHAQRIIEAHKKGFYHLLFDDNPPIQKLYAYGLPGIPTANMVHHGVKLNSSAISWHFQGEEKNYYLKMEEMAEAKDHMLKHEVFPDVGGPTRYGGFSFLTYVRLKED